MSRKCQKCCVYQLVLGAFKRLDFWRLHNLPCIFGLRTRKEGERLQVGNDSRVYLVQEPTQVFHCLCQRKTRFHQFVSYQGLWNGLEISPAVGKICTFQRSQLGHCQCTRDMPDFWTRCEIQGYPSKQNRSPSFVEWMNLWNVCTPLHRRKTIRVNFRRPKGVQIADLMVGLGEIKGRKNTTVCSLMRSLA